MQRCALLDGEAKRSGLKASQHLWFAIYNLQLPEQALQFPQPSQVTSQVPQLTKQVQCVREQWASMRLFIVLWFEPHFDAARSHLHSAQFPQSQPLQELPRSTPPSPQPQPFPHMSQSWQELQPATDGSEEANVCRM